jgi:hypothetical protein
VVLINPIDSSVNKKLNAVMQGLMGKGVLENKVKEEWQKKHKILENLSQENLAELKKMDLKLLKGLKFEGADSEFLFDVLKRTDIVTHKQKEFAKFIYDNYTKHSLKAQGFD